MMPRPDRAYVPLDAEPLVAVRRYRFYAEHTGWWGLGIAYVPDVCDVHVAVLVWCIGFSWQREYPE